MVLLRTLRWWHLLPNAAEVGGPWTEAPACHGMGETWAASCLTDSPAQKRIHTKSLSPVWALGVLVPVSVAPLAGSLARAVCS